MFTRAGCMRDSRVSYWNPNHFTLLVPKNEIQGNTDWPEQRKKWLEIKNNFEQIGDTVSKIVLIDEYEGGDDDSITTLSPQTTAAEIKENVSNDTNKDSIPSALTTDIEGKAHNTNGESPMDPKWDEPIKVAIKSQEKPEQTYKKNRIKCSKMNWSIMLILYQVSRK